MVTQIIRPGSSGMGKLVALAIQHAYQQGLEVYDPDFALNQDEVFWEKLQRDCVAKAAIEDRLRSVAGREFNVVPGGRRPEKEDHRAASLMEEVLDHCTNLFEGRYHLAKAIFQGNAWSFVETRRKRIRFEGAAYDVLVPHRLTYIDKRQMRKFVDTVPKTANLRESLSPVTTRWQYAPAGRPGTWVDVPRDAPFVRWVYDDEPTRLGHGRGLAEALYFIHYAKGVILKEGLQGLVRWAQSWIVAKVDGSTATSDLSNEATRDAYISMLEKHRSGGIFAMDAADELQVIQSGGEGHQQVMEWLAYCDRTIRQICNGSNLPFGGDSGDGSRARAEVEAGTTEGLYQTDRVGLDECLTRQMISRLWAWNADVRRDLGLAGARMPRLSCVQQPREDPSKAVEVIGKALQSGVPLIKSEVYSKLGFSEPGADDVVFEGFDMQQQNALLGSTLTGGSLPDAPDA